MEPVLPKDLANNKTNLPPYNGWKINPKYKAPSLGAYVYTQSNGDIRPMNGSIEHLRRENRLDELTQDDWDNVENV